MDLVINHGFQWFFILPWLRGEKNPWIKNNDPFSTPTPTLSTLKTPLKTRALEIIEWKAWVQNNIISLCRAHVPWFYREERDGWDQVFQTLLDFSEWEESSQPPLPKQVIWCEEMDDSINVRPGQTFKNLNCLNGPGWVKKETHKVEANHEVLSCLVNGPIVMQCGLYHCPHIPISWVCFEHTMYIKAFEKPVHHRKIKPC